ncbi:MAG: DegT/DnrJ/EryC1/StrS aminotransferase family protein [Betaproteobacteria bacterium]|nr:DegT/DnrJ/EryC1/StrS aminotransferase family protein [Betaproteobacteria bacterium]
MSLDYQVFDPSPCSFPRPRVPVLPRGFAPASTEDAALLRDVPSLSGQGLHFTRGRYALGEAYRRAGLDGYGALLAPAYHCVTMLDPALALGADVLLYTLDSDLAPDPVALDVLAERSAKPVKALLATHFFGFVRDFSWLKQWCYARGIVFVEDCSHTLFTERYQAKGAGWYGRFVASSPYKFLPSADGGWLYAPDAAVLASAVTQPASWLAELRGMKQCLDAARQPRVSPADITALDRQLAVLAKRTPVAGDEQRRQRPAQSSQYQLEAERRAALRSSRWLIGHSSIRAAIQRRQANYRRWLQAVTSLPNCHPLYPELPEQVVPYMFPLYIAHPMPHFYWLKQLAVPVWRWDEMAVSACPVAADYRLHLLHLPCHQSLSDDEMDWMVAAVGKVLRLPVAGALR